MSYFRLCYNHCIKINTTNAWTATKDMETKVQAAEMRFLRRMIKISWTDRVSNEMVFQRAGTKRKLMKMIRKRQLRFLGHEMRLQQLENV